MSESDLAIITAQTPDTFRLRHNDLITFVKSQLKESKNIQGGTGGDYGIIPYTKKKTLLKPGAEKLLKLFGFSARNELVKEFEDFQNGFVMYKYKCTITHTASGTFIADATRSANSKEPQVMKQNKTVYETANAVEAKAQKRALVAATVQATMATEIFDADVSENDIEAPNKSVTKDEDPKRIKIAGRLYGVAGDHGWTDKWIHTAIKKKWGVESLTNCSNEQLEELSEFIAANYKPVAKGEKPQQLSTTPPAVVNKLSGDQPELSSKPIEGEVVPSEYWCHGSKHKADQPETRVATTVDDPWCSKECENEYYPPTKEKKTYPWQTK